MVDWDKLHKELDNELEKMYSEDWKEWHLKKYNMKQDSTVEWLKYQIEKGSDTTFHNLDWSRFDQLIQQAKEMEEEKNKQLVINTYLNLTIKKNKLPYGFAYFEMLEKKRIEGEEYYNKNFKK